MIKPDSCKGCPLYHIGLGFSKPDGLGKSGIIIIGEALGHDEMIDGLPFRPKAQAGSKLQECINANAYLNVTRDDFLFWNVVACQPPGNRLIGQRWTNEAIRFCSVHFNSVVGDFNNPNPKSGSKIILALGNTAFQYVTGTSLSVLDIRGYPFSPCLDIRKLGVGVVVGSLHPSYIKRGNGKLTPLLVEDIRKVVEISRSGWTGKELLPPPSNMSSGYQYREEEDESIPF